MPKLSEFQPAGKGKDFARLFLPKICYMTNAPMTMPGYKINEVKKFRRWENVAVRLYVVFEAVKCSLWND